MVEQGVLGGSELTVGVFDGKALLPIQIKPAVEFYDYEAKYQRNDTQYLVDPPLPAGVKATIQKQAEDLFQAMGCRHLSRIDFLLDRDGLPWLLEVNTLPGFTDHSLFPMAAKQAGMPMEKLCSQLAHMAIRDGAKDRVR
jgi:D-alanine-D-alanine ligase